MYRHYSTKLRRSIAILLLAVVVFICAYGGMRRCMAAREITCWALCKPGAQVMLRATPEKDGQIVGYLEAGDSFRTDAESRNGYIRAYGIGDGGGWVYCGFVVTDKPEMVNERYVCVAKNRAACRRWCDGPRIDGRPGWIYNGTNVQVFYKSDEWCVTARGYIQTEWLEVDPE